MKEKQRQKPLPLNSRLENQKTFLLGTFFSCRTNLTVCFFFPVMLWSNQRAGKGGGGTESHRETSVQGGKATRDSQSLSRHLLMRLREGIKFSIGQPCHHPLKGAVRWMMERQWHLTDILEKKKKKKKIEIKRKEKKIEKGFAVFWEDELHMEARVVWGAWSKEGIKGWTGKHISHTSSFPGSFRWGA